MTITSLSGNSAQPLFTTTTPTLGTTCPCLTVAANGRQRITALAANSASIHGSIRETLAAAHGIDWNGKAANHYRDRIATVRNSLSEHDDEARSTAQVAQVSQVALPQGGA